MAQSKQQGHITALQRLITTVDIAQTEYFESVITTDARSKVQVFMMACFLTPRRNLIGQLSALFLDKEKEVEIKLEDEEKEDGEEEGEEKEREEEEKEEPLPSDKASHERASVKDSDSKIYLSRYQCLYLEQNDNCQKVVTRVLEEAGFKTSWHIDQTERRGFIEVETEHKPISEALQLVENLFTDVEVKVSKDVVYMMPDIHIRDIRFKPREIMVSVDIEKERIVFTGPKKPSKAVADRLDSASYAVMAEGQGSDSPFSLYLADKQSVPVREECFKYICRYKLEEIEYVNGVDRPIYVSGTEVKDGFSIDIEGPVDDLQRGVALIGEITLVTKTSQFCLDSKSEIELDPSVTSSIEEKYGCVMEYQPPELFRKETKEEAFKETTIEVKFAEIQNVECDVLVNTTKKNLDVSAGWGVSATIHKSGGSGIQQELRKRYPMGIEHDEIAVSGPGKLKNCRAIYHVSLPPHSKDDSSYTKLVLLVKNCLQAASGAGHTSIAFPAMGLGAMHYPPDYTVRLMFETVTRYLQVSPSPSIEHVFFVVYPSANIYLRQLFMMEKLSNALKTRVVTSVQSLYEDLRVLELNPPCFEACLPVNKSYLQVMCSDVRTMLDVTQCAVILWSAKGLEENDNIALHSINPLFKITFTHNTELMKSKCVLDKTTLPDRVLIHSLCTQDDDTNITQALERALRLAKKENTHMLTIPVVDDGTRLGAPNSAAPLIMDAVLRLNCPQIVVSVAVPDQNCFQEFVVMAMECNGRNVKVLPSVSDIVDCVWRQEASASVPGDSMLLVTSESKESHLDAAREFAHRCNMDIAFMS